MAFDVKWTPEDTEKLRTFWKAGLSGAQIAHQLGNRYTRAGVIGKANRLKLAPRESNFNRIGPYSHPTKPQLIPSSRPKPPPKPLPVASDEPPPIGPLNTFPAKGFCRYIHGDVQGEWRCCGAAAVGSYCEHHGQICRVKPNSHHIKGAY